MYITSTDSCLTSTDTYTCTSLVQTHVLTSTLCFTHASKSISLFLGTSSAGNRSPISPMNIGTSSVTIFGVLKSLNALINTYTHHKLKKINIKKYYTYCTCTCKLYIILPGLQAFLCLLSLVIQLLPVLI